MGSNTACLHKDLQMRGGNAVYLSVSGVFSIPVLGF